MVIMKSVDLPACAGRDRSLYYAHHRQVAGDSPVAEAVKLLARVSEPDLGPDTASPATSVSAAGVVPRRLQASDDLAAGEALELPDRAPDPDPDRL
jgi:hypothetical protein